MKVKNEIRRRRREEPLMSLSMEMYVWVHEVQENSIFAAD